MVIAAIAAVFLWGLASLAHGAEARPSWRIEWEKTVEAAKREGQVTVYIDYSAGAILEAGAFQRAYPGIKVLGVPNRTSEIRIMAERRAGKYIPDVNIAGVTQNYPELYNRNALDPVRHALILPEVLDESGWWQGRHRYADPQNGYVFIFLGIPQTGSAHFNTRLVNPKEFHSFWDLLNPKWKGKIAARDMRAQGPGRGGLRFFYNNPELGAEFIKGLFGRMDVTLFRDPRQGTDWLATGKFALCFACEGIDKAKTQGLPVDSFTQIWKEGAAVVAQWGTVALINRAPHPNAAKVFINWFLSRDGQTALLKALGKAEDSAPDSLRVDIPKDDVKPGERRIDGAKYLEMFSPHLMDMRPPLKIYEEAIAEAQKR